MWWLAYLIIFGKRRSPCETYEHAEPADDRATTASSDHPEDAAATAHTVRTSDPVDIEPIDDAPTRQDIVDALNHMSKTAGALRRQGYIGIHGHSYARIHHAIDGLLYDLAAMDLDESLVLEA